MDQLILMWSQALGYKLSCKWNQIHPKSYDRLVKLGENNVKVWCAERWILPAASRWSGSDLWGKSPAGLWGSAPPRTLRPAALLQRRRRAAAMRRGARHWAAWSSAWSWCATACGVARSPSQIVSQPRAKHLFIWLLPSARSTLSFDIFFSFCHA